MSTDPTSKEWYPRSRAVQAFAQNIPVNAQRWVHPVAPQVPIAPQAPPPQQPDNADALFQGTWPDDAYGLHVPQSSQHVFHRNPSVPLLVSGGGVPPSYYTSIRVPPSVLPPHPSSALHQDASQLSPSSTQGLSSINQLYVSSPQAFQGPVPQQPTITYTTNYPPPVPPSSGRHAASSARAQVGPQVGPLAYTSSQQSAQNPIQDQRSSAAPQLTVIPGFFIVDPSHPHSAAPGAPGPGYFIPLPGATQYNNWFAAARPPSTTTRGSHPYPGPQHSNHVAPSQAVQPNSAAHANPARESASPRGSSGWNTQTAPENILTGAFALPGTIYPQGQDRMQHTPQQRQVPMGLPGQPHSVRHAPGGAPIVGEQSPRREHKRKNPPSGGRAANEGRSFRYSAGSMSQASSSHASALDPSAYVGRFPGMP